MSRFGLPSEAFTTYQVARPVLTHWKVATCAQVDCERRARGWRMAFDLADPQKRAAAKWIKHHSQRAFTVESQDGDIVTLAFAAGQDCFETHHASLERDPIFVIRGGDQRGNPRGTQARVLSGISWRDDFGEHQQTLADTQERG